MALCCSGFGLFYVLLSGILDGFMLFCRLIVFFPGRRFCRQIVGLTGLPLILQTLSGDRFQNICEYHMKYWLRTIRRDCNDSEKSDYLEEFAMIRKKVIIQKRMQ